MTRPPIDAARLPERTLRELDALFAEPEHGKWQDLDRGRAGCGAQRVGLGLPLAAASTTRSATQAASTTCRRTGATRTFSA